MTLNNDQMKVYDHLINACTKVGFPVAVAVKQLYQESRFKNLTSPAGAYGVAQFMPATWQETFNEMRKNNLFKIYGCDNPVNDRADYKTAIACYLYHMSVMIPRQLSARGYPVTWENILRGYNAGVGNLIKSQKFKETNDYIKIILGENKNLLDHLPKLAIGLILL